MAARGRHLQRALGGRLAAHLGKVSGGERGGEQRGGVDGGRRAEHFAAEVRDRLGERLDAEDRRAAGERRLGRVDGRDHEGAERRAARRRGDGERAAHAVHAAVEPELAEHAPAGEVQQAEVAEGGEEPEGDRQVERDEPIAQLATRIPKDLHRRLKLHCVTNDIMIQDFVVEAIEEKLGRKAGAKKGTR